MNDQLERTIRTFVQGLIVALLTLAASKGFDVTGFVDVDAFAIAVASLITGVAMGGLAWVMALLFPPKNTAPASVEPAGGNDNG